MPIYEFSSKEPERIQEEAPMPPPRPSLSKIKEEPKERQEKPQEEPQKVVFKPKEIKNEQVDGVFGSLAIEEEEL